MNATKVKSLIETLRTFRRDIAVLFLAGVVVLYGLHACATSAFNKRNFSFEFGAASNKDVEVLNWRYGNSKEPFTHAPKAYQEMGHIPQGWNTGGPFPPGDVLYVKWRVLTTGKVYEDTVDLSRSLPDDLFGKAIHFDIKGPQLYVYLINGITASERHEKDKPDCPVAIYSDFKCSRLYPDHWANFY